MADAQAADQAAEQLEAASLAAGGAPKKVRPRPRPPLLPSRRRLSAPSSQDRAAVKAERAAARGSKQQTAKEEEDPLAHKFGDAPLVQSQKAGCQPPPG